MTSYRHTCEGTDAVVITTSNAPSGSDNFSFVLKETNGILEYDTAHATSTGNSSIRFGSVSTDRGHVRWSGFTVDKLAMRAYFYLAAIPSTTQTVVAAQAAASARVASLAVTSSGYLNIGGNPTSPVVGSTATLSTGIWYRLEMSVDRIANDIVANVYNGHNTSPLPGLSINATTLDLGAAQIIQLMIGKYSTTGAAEFWMDDLALDTGTTTLIGPVDSAVPHFTLSAVYPADGYESISGWEIDATASVGTTTLTQTGGTTATPTGIGGVYSISNPTGTDDLTYRLTATVGAMSSNTTIVIHRGVVSSSLRQYQWTFQGGDPTDIADWG